MPLLKEEARLGMRLAICAFLALLAVLATPPNIHGQVLLMSDDFESSGSALDSTRWPYTAGTRLESAQSFFGVSNRYFSIAGAGVKALSANWSAALNGQPSTFAFDFFDPTNSGNGVVLGYAAGTSDLNTAGAFARIEVGGGAITFAGTDGTVLTNTGMLTYPRGTRLTFSLALNPTAASQPFQSVNLAPKTLDVWYYNWTNRQSVYVLSVDVSASTRSPVCVGFRTWSASTNAQFYVDNVKLLDTAVVVTPDLVLAEPPLPPIVPPRPLVHPCVFNSQQELERIKYRVNHDPAAAAVLGWNQMLNSGYASLSYQHNPYTNVVVMGSGTTPSESQFRQDAHAARAAALRWVIGGDSRYRDQAVRIMNDWANTFQTMSPASGTSSSQVQLEAAWAVPIWVAAADLLRYYDHGAAGWSASEIAQFDRLLNYLYTQAAKAAGDENNWGASAALTMTAIGAYQDNRSRFEAGVQTWRDRLVGINAAVGNNGFINEVCRDTVHPQYTLQVWMQAAEVAWKQGVDLYATPLSGSSVPQFSINLENFARLFLGLAQPPCSASFLTNYNYLGEQRRSGAYDIAYNHYCLRAGLTNPPTYYDLVLNHWRPGGWDEHFCSWSTLTHGQLSAGIPAIAALNLWQSSSNAGLETLTDGDTLNLRTLAGTCVLTAQTAGTVSRVQFYTNGAAFGPAATNAPWQPGSFPPPGNYFLGALASQNLPAGSIPGDLFTRFIRVVDLPAGWAMRDLGTPAVPAWAQERNGSLTLTAAGTNILGAADQGGFVSAAIAGDLQLTAALPSLTAPALSAQAGLIVRDGTRPEARQVFLSLSPPGTNLASLAWRLSSAGTTSVSNLALPSRPLWLRLVRLGDVFSGYYSADRQVWVPFATVTVPMNRGVQAGFALASGLSNTTAQASFQGVLLEPLNASFAQWQNYLFAARGVTDAAAISPAADPDGDGRSNLAEYWLGSDPLTADAAPALSLPTVTPGTRLRLQFTERRNADALGRQFQFSADLRVWNPLTPESVTDLQDLGSVVVREVTFPLPATQGFYRAIYGLGP